MEELFGVLVATAAATAGGAVHRKRTRERSSAVQLSAPRQSADALVAVYYFFADGCGVAGFRRDALCETAMAPPAEAPKSVSPLSKVGGPDVPRYLLRCPAKGFVATLLGT
jgi:hypothetical protein